MAAAVEARHYPHLPPVPRLPLGESLKDAVNFLGLLIAVNVVALFFYALAGPFVPLLFWALNGLLLGREYFTLTALRHLSPADAKRLYRANRATVWVAGTLMAAPLSIPLLNLLVPIFGVATFTHIFHRLHKTPT